MAYSGIFPIVPTPFLEDGALDLESQRRVLDFMIDQGVDGLCVLANYSEQFLLSDEERAILQTACLRHVDGRVPVIVTCSHFSTRVAVERCRRAEDEGAAMVMLMPPYHGALLRADDDGIFEFFARVSASLGIPVMVQDAPLSGVTLGIHLLARLARELPRVAYFKIECPGAAAKLRALIAAAGGHIDGPFDGEEGVTLLDDLDAGATGTMTSALASELIRPVVRHHLSGDRTSAAAAYEHVLPLVHFENRQCGLRACKAVMMEGGVIHSDRVRHPLTPLLPATRARLLDLAARFDLLALRWGS